MKDKKLSSNAVADLGVGKAIFVSTKNIGGNQALVYVWLTNHSKFASSAGREGSLKYKVQGGQWVAAGNVVVPASLAPNKKHRAEVKMTMTELKAGTAYSFSLKSTDPNPGNDTISMMDPLGVEVP